MMSSDKLNFHGQVAVVTGAGAGLGRSHALLLAARGASVVVNDFGTDLTGIGQSSTPADQVVAEIEAAGGTAVANYDGVHTSDGANAIIATALNRFGKIDILVCNAGILLYEPFAEVTDEVWRRTLAVHLDGTMFTARAAWPEMKRRGYGRVVVTSSGGMLGKTGLAAYSAAKAGIYGLMRTMSVEIEAGEDIMVNALLPCGTSRMLSPDTLRHLDVHPDLADPAHISPVVAYLASRACRDSGKAYTAGGGFVARDEMVQGQGVRFDRSGGITPEQIEASWAGINDLSDPRVFDSALSSGAAMFGFG